MLIGQYESIIGDKNRTSVPRKLRNELGDSLIIARWYENCLVVVPTNSWERLVNRLTGTVRMVTQSVRDTDRFILGSAYELTPDNQGRIVLPANLIEYANLGSEIVFLGLGDRVEIWSKEEWKKRQNYIAENASDIVERLVKEGESNA